MSRSVSARLAAWAMLFLVGAAFFGLTQKLPYRAASYDLNTSRLQMHFQQVAVPRPEGAVTETQVVQYLRLWLDSLQLPAQHRFTPHVQHPNDSTSRIRYQHKLWTTLRGEDSTKTLLVSTSLGGKAHTPDASGAANIAAMLEAVAFLKQEKWKPEQNVIFFWGELPEELVSKPVHHLRLTNLGTAGHPVLLSPLVPPAGGAKADALFSRRLESKQTWLTPLKRGTFRNTGMDTPDHFDLELLARQTNALIHYVEEFREQAAASQQEVAGYFSLPILGQFVYTHIQAQILGMTWGGVFIALLILGLIRGTISIGSYLWSLLVVPVLVGAAGLGASILWQLTAQMHPSLSWWGESLFYAVPAQEFFIMALTLLTMGGFWLLYGFFAGFLRAIELGGAALSWGGIGLAAALLQIPLWDYLPFLEAPAPDWLLTADVLHIWLLPLYFALLSWTYVLLRGRRVQDYNPADTFILTIFLLPAGWYLGEIWMTFFALEGLDKVTLLSCLLAGWMSLFLPQWRVLAGGLRWTIPLLALFCGIGILIYAHVGLAFSRHHKKPNSAFFAINLSADKAFWGSHDQEPDTYTRQFFGNLPRQSQLPEFFPRSEGSFMVQSDSMRYLPVPEVKKVADSIGSTDSLRYVSLRWKASKRQAEESWLYLPDSLGLYRLHIPEQSISLNARQSQKIELVGIDSLDFQLVLPARAPLNLSLIEVKSGLQEVWNYTRMPRRLYMMPRPNLLSHAVLLRKDFEFEPVKP